MKFRLERLYINDATVSTRDVWSSSKVQEQIDAGFERLDWQESVLARWDASVELPVPGPDARYLCSVGGNGWNAKSIYQWNGQDWVEILPNMDMVVAVENENPPYGLEYLYDGTSWIRKSAATPHNWFQGLQGGSELLDERYHLDKSQHDTLTLGSDASALHTHATLYYDKTEIGTILADYYTSDQVDTLLSGYYTAAALDNGALDSRYFTETELLTNGALDDRYYTEAELGTEGILDTRYFTKDQIDSMFGNYYTSLQLDDGSLDARYYTKGEIDTLLGGYYTSGTIDTMFAAYYTSAALDLGALNGLYFTETELLPNPVGVAGDGVLDARYYIESEIDTMLGAYFTSTELLTDGVLDARYYTEHEIDLLVSNEIGIDHVDGVTLEWDKTIDTGKFTTAGNTVPATISSAWGGAWTTITAGTSTSGTMLSEFLGGVWKLGATPSAPLTLSALDLWFISSDVLSSCQLTGGTLGTLNFEYQGVVSGWHVYRLPMPTSGSTTGFLATGAVQFTGRLTEAGIHPYQLNYEQIKDGGVSFAKLDANTQSLIMGLGPQTVSATADGQTVFTFTGSVSTYPVVFIDGAMLLPSDYSVTGDKEITLIGAYAGGVADGTVVGTFHTGGSGVSNVDIASQSEAEEGTNNTKMMSPLRTLQAIEANRVEATWLLISSNHTCGGTENLLVDCSSAGLEITLPPSPSLGTTVRIRDFKQFAATNNIIVRRNGLKISGNADDMTINSPGPDVFMVYTGAAFGWSI